MRKIIIFSICTLLNVAVYGQRGEVNVANLHLNIKGTYSSSVINGYVRDAAFYNDTCYLVSGDGKKILMTKSDGAAVTTNYFSSITFNEALKVYADDAYVLVLDFDYLRYYTKKGVLKYSIPVATSDYWYGYFWVRSEREIMLVSNNSILVYDYSTRALLKSFTPSYKFTENTNNFDRFVNDGQKLYDCGIKLVTYEYDSRFGIRVNDITTSKYTSLKKDNYLCYIGIDREIKPLWFNYFNRSRAFFSNSSFDNVEYLGSFLPASKNPTSDDLYTESGNPNLKVFIGSSDERISKIYVLNISLNKAEFYMLE